MCNSSGPSQGVSPAGKAVSGQLEVGDVFNLHKLCIRSPFAEVDRSLAWSQRSRRKGQPVFEEPEGTVLSGTIRLNATN